MRNPPKILLLGLILLTVVNMKAGHISGSEISYRYIGDSTNTAHHYEVSLRITRIIQGQGMGSHWPMQVSSSCYPTFSFNLSHFTTNQNAQPSPSNSECVSSGISTYLVHIYKGDVVLQGTCVDFKFHFDLNFTNLRQNVVNLYQSSSIRFHNEAWLNNTFFENDLIVFTNDGAVGLCPQVPVEWPLSYYNPDGDSLYFSFAPIITPTGPANYFQPYSYQNPISTQSNTPFYIDPTTGVIVVTPSVSQIVSVMIQVREFRHDSTTTQWVEVGRAFKDFIVVVVQSCSSNYLEIELEVDTLIDCHQRYIDIDFERDVRTNTIEKTGSDFVIFGPDSFLLAIDNVEVFHSTSTNRASNVRLHLLDSVMLNGRYHVVTRIGSDFNTLITPCGFEVNPFDTIATFNIADASCGNISVDEIKLPQVKIYPNPVQDQLTINPHNGRPYSVMMFDTQGRLLMHLENLTDKQTIDVKNLAMGVYLAKVMNGKTLIANEKISKSQ